MDYCCKHERRWNEKRIVPKVKRVAAPLSRASQAASLSLLCAKPATEPEAALRRLTFVYQTMLVHSSLCSPSHLALWQITMVTGMLTAGCPASSAARRHYQHVQRLSRCWLDTANWRFKRFWYHFSNYAYFIKGL